MQKIKSPRIIFFDLETTPVEYLKFQFDRNPFFNPDGIIKDWSIICGSWQVLGEDKVHSINVRKVGGDYNVVKKIRDVLATADIIGGHNVDKFDMRVLMARMIYHGIDPLPNIPTIDTKKEYKKLGAFTSNKLDYLAKTLTGSGKLETTFSLWLQVRDGSKIAMKRMVDYNKVDVVKNVEIYNIIRPYMRTHPHIGVIAGESRFHSCGNCGSTHLKRNGVRPTKAGILKQEVQCKVCGSYHRIPITK